MIKSKILLSILSVLLLLSVNLFCQDADATPKIDVKVKINVLSGDEEAQGEIIATVDIPKGVHAVKQEDYLYIYTQDTPWIKFLPTLYPKGVKNKDEIDYYGQVILRKKFKLLQAIPDDVSSLKIAVGYQVCGDVSGTCFFPEEEEFNIALDKDVFGTTAKTGGNALNIIRFLLMALLGGIILNVMPCVLPVLSIKAMHLVHQSHHDKKTIMAGSFAYTAGIIVSFVIMAAVVIVIKVSGESVGWGFQFQNIGFVMVLASILFAFSLSLFDVFLISAPGMNLATKASSKSGHMGSFLSGVFAVLLATPCTAPFLGAALGFAFSQPPVLIMAFFVTIGIGLAFPFILLAFWPGVVKLIPKPGEWMNTFKEFMGFLLLGTTVFLLRTALSLVGGSNFIRILWYLVFLGLACWVYGRFSRPEFSKAKQWLALIVAVGIVVFSVVFFLNFTEYNGDDAAHMDGWEKFTPEAVDEYRAQGKPVFVDFGADWCMTCVTNEKTVLFTDFIQEEFKKYDVALLRGDNTKKNPLVMEWLKKYKRAGVPLYLLFRPGEESAHVFPEIITKDMVLDELEKIKQ